MNVHEPKYLTTKEVLSYLRIGRDALRSMMKDSEKYGIPCPCVDIARGTRIIYRWETGKKDPYKEVDLWLHTIAEKRKSHNRRYPNGYKPPRAPSLPKATRKIGKRSRLRDLIHSKEI